MDDSNQPPAKRRKTKKNKNDPNVVTFANGRTFSLEAYLAGPQAQQGKKDNDDGDAVVATTEEKSESRKEIEVVVREDSRSASQGDDSKVKDEKKNIRKKLDTKNGQEGRSPAKFKTREDPTLLKTRRALPIWQHRADIQQAVGRKDSDVLVLVGETGSGKSTQVPQFLYQEPWCKRQSVKIPGSSSSSSNNNNNNNEEVFVGGTIAITQPRRVAATTLAHRVAQEAGTPLGSGRKDGSVGYSVRFDHQVPRGTKIKFLTEGMLLQELLRDPNLRQYSAVVVDEIHERSLDVDLLVGFLKQILAGDRAGRGGVALKVIIMSATADVDLFKGFFTDIYPEERRDTAVQVLRIKGRQFPVSVIHTPKPVTAIDDALVQTVFKVHTQEPLPGDILAFLTGQEEIEAAQKMIEEYAETLDSKMPKIKVFPLYGQLSMEAQSQAFLPVKTPFTRKVVLATNIAETSVTVPGVRFVIDGGKSKVKQFRSRLNMESLLAKPISKSSAVQRTGRAGREAPGKCFRLYTKSSFEGLEESDLPEILRTDVLGAVLTMKARGIHDVLSFPLMDTPDAEAIEKALFHLHTLQAIDDNGKITPTGELMARLPLSPPLGAVLLASSKPEFDCLLDVIDIISCITSGEDIFQQIHSEETQEEITAIRKDLQRREGDVITYLTTMQQYTAENADRQTWCKKRKINTRNMKQALNIRRQLRSFCLKENLLTCPPPSDPQPFTPTSPEKAETILKCFLRGFVLKTAMLHPDASYVTWHGKHTVAVHPASVLHGQKKEAIMFLDYVFTNKGYGKKVSAIQADWIVEAFQG